MSQRRTCRRVMMFVVLLLLVMAVRSSFALAVIN
jgi:hypothetical protein